MDADERGPMTFADALAISEDYLAQAKRERQQARCWDHMTEGVGRVTAAQEIVDRLRAARRYGKALALALAGRP